MNKIAVISHTEHYYDTNGEIVGWEPTIREIDCFPDFFDLIIVDECHRTQYQNLAINLSLALPNALKIGFSGTPIETEDKSTSYVFGEDLHRYKINDAVRDQKVKRRTKTQKK